MGLLLEVQLPYGPSYPSIGRSVCYNFGGLVKYQVAVDMQDPLEVYLAIAYTKSESLSSMQNPSTQTYIMWIFTFENIKGL